MAVRLGQPPARRMPALAGATRSNKIVATLPPRERLARIGARVATTATGAQKQDCPGHPCPRRGDGG